MRFNFIFEINYSRKHENRPHVSLQIAKCYNCWSLLLSWLKGNPYKGWVVMKKRSLDEIQLARAFAIIAVLIVHSSSEGVTSIPVDSSLFPIYNFFNIAGKLGTPTFIMLSSFILFYNYYSREATVALFKNFYIKRIKFILIPYIVFSVIYFLVKWYLFRYYDTPVEALQVFFGQLAIGKVYPHLYFVFISVQFYLMFPLIMMLFKKFRFLRINAIWIGLLIQWVWVFLNREYLQVTYKGSISLSYMSFYFVGAFLGIYYEQIMEKMKKLSFRIKVFVPLLLGYLALVVMYTGYMYLVRTNAYGEWVAPLLPNWVNSNIAEFTWATHALLAGLVLFFTAYFVQDRLGAKMKTFFMEIGATSFGIYLIHPLLLILFRNIVPGGSPVVFHSWQIFTFFAISIISWAIVRGAFKWVPYYWILFGKIAPFKAVKDKRMRKAS